MPHQREGITRVATATCLNSPRAEKERSWFVTVPMPHAFSGCHADPGTLRNRRVAQKAVELPRATITTHRSHDNQHHDAFSGRVRHTAPFWKQPIERKHHRRPP